MAKITITISEDEKKDVIKAIKRLGKHEMLAVSKIAKEAGMNPNRVRFIIEDLVDEGRIVRHVAKSFNARWIRYKYEVIK